MNKRPYLSDPYTTEFEGRIVNRLKHAGLVTIRRGYRGGVVLARWTERISLLEVVRAMEGNQPVSRCAFGLAKCPAGESCPAHAPWNRMRKQIEALLRRTTLSAMMKSTALARASSLRTNKRDRSKRGLKLTRFGESPASWD